MEERRSLVLAGRNVMKAVLTEPVFCVAFAAAVTTW